MLFTFAEDIESESILFRDGLDTDLQLPGALFRRPIRDELDGIQSDQLPWHGIIEWEGIVAGRGGILFHYNPPYGDIYMEVEEAFRRRGIGSFLVQELKRRCYQGGFIPGARCNPENVASRYTLQKAGFIPCGHMLTGHVKTS